MGRVDDLRAVAAGDGYGQLGDVARVGLVETGRRGQPPPAGGDLDTYLRPGAASCRQPADGNLRAVAGPDRRPRVRVRVFWMLCHGPDGPLASHRDSHREGHLRCWSTGLDVNLLTASCVESCFMAKSRDPLLVTGLGGRMTAAMFITKTQIAAMSTPVGAAMTCGMTEETENAVPAGACILPATRSSSDTGIRSCPRGSTRHRHFPEVGHRLAIVLK